MTARVLHGDALEQLATLPDASVDAVVTDPPYGLANTSPAQVVEALTRWTSGDRAFLPSGRGFMGHEWDGFVPPPAVWDECLRVLKPGGHLLAFAGSRTHDLMGLGIRLAGFEIRDSVAWLYGSGFPKSLDVSKAIASGGGRPEDIRRMAMGDEYVPSGRGRVNYDHGGGSAMNGTIGGIELPPAARQWEGWGTALKPAFEPVTLARKPLEGTVAANVLEHGTGALNIDACRVGMSDADRAVVDSRSGGLTEPADGTFLGGIGQRDGLFKSAPGGRWPANVVLDESQAAELDRQSGNVKTGATKPHQRDPDSAPMFKVGKWMTHSQPASEGGASRFFYVAKAPSSERPVVDGVAHPTVKPLQLMRWLVRMVTPPGGVVLDPFAGSGTTLEAGVLEGVDVIGVEREDDYHPLILARLQRAEAEVERLAREAAERPPLFEV